MAITCTICDKTFTHMSSLRRHMKSFHDPSAAIFQCPTCDMTFKRKDKRGDHMPACRGLGKGTSGERAVKVVLDELKLEYEHDIVFDEFEYDLGSQRFDYIVYKADGSIFGMIEFDGGQHYKPTTFGGPSIAKATLAYIKTRKHDRMKDEFCKDNDFPLLRIPYTHQRRSAEITRAFLADPLGYVQPRGPRRHTFRGLQA